MNRKIHDVRKQIKKRKKHREQPITYYEKTWQHQNPAFLSEEEKHGYGMPTLPETANMKWKGKRKRFPTQIWKVIISILIFGCTAFILQNKNEEASTSQEWLQAKLEQEFPFAKVNQWYVTSFGSPLALSPQGKLPNITDDQSKALPVLGQVVETFSSSGTGIKISPQNRSMVTSLDQGVVIFAGNDKQTEQTIIVQHADGTNTTYGFLSSIDVHLYQAVQPNQTIGSFTPTEENEFVYFSIEKDNQFIDPSQVVPVHDVP